jgi:hypothetical protein
MCENALLRAELAEARTIIMEIMEGKPDDVRLLRESLSAVDHGDVNGSLVEWLRLAGHPVSQRRYSEAMYEFAFILRRTSSPDMKYCIRSSRFLLGRTCRHTSA